MQDFIWTLMICSATMSVLSILLMLISPLLSKRYDNKWQYYAWIIIIVGFIFPFRPDFNFNIFSVSVPVSMVQDNIASVEKNNENEAILSVRVLDNPNTFQIDILPTHASIMGMVYGVVFAIWIIGAVVTFSGQLLRHYRLATMINRWKEDATDIAVMDILQEQTKMLNISKSITVHICPLITGSMLVGLIKPAIMLQTSKYTYEELSFMIRHELIHFKHNDLFVKLLVLIVKSIHWFNPIVYLVDKAISSQCEKACDDAVVGNADLSIRKRYALLISKVAEARVVFQTALSTNFYGGKYNMKNRLVSIMCKSKKRMGALIVASVFILTLCTNIVIAANVSLSEKQTLDSLMEGTSGTLEYTIDSTSDIRSMMYSSSTNQKTKEIIQITWKDQEEYSELEWWTYEEYKTWLDEQGIIIEQTSGSSEWEFINGSYIPVREDSYETYEFHSFMLNRINNGLKVAKSVSDSDYFVISRLSYYYFHYSYYSAFKLADGEVIFVGPLGADTYYNLYLQIKDHFGKHVAEGKLTSEEVADIFAVVEIPTEWFSDGE